MTKQNIKQVKMHTRSRICTNSWNESVTKDVPWLNVSGSWLDKLGFAIGTKVNITMLDKKLIIEPADLDSINNDVDI